MKWIVWFSLVALTVVLAAGWSYSLLTDNRVAAQAAASDYASCKYLASQIEALRKKPQVAVARELQVTELSRRLEEALEAADIDAGNLVRVAPEPPRRVSDSNYLERATELTLRDVTLRQIILFLTKLSAEGSGLAVDHLRLTASRSAEAQGDWAAELAVSYLIYSPKTDQVTARTDAGNAAGGTP